MSALPEMPRQRAGREAATRLQTASKEALRPFHDDILTEAGPSFRGLTAFVVDRWHEGSANDVATLQPATDDRERYRFYDENIKQNRIDLAATAFGQAMNMNHAQHLRSRMNPDHHLTYAAPVTNHDRAIGGVQSVFDTSDGHWLAEEKLASIYQTHTPAIETVLHEFDALALSHNVRSLGDTLELLTPTTPNAFTISWDLVESTKLALSEEHYGALRNYLLDAKTIFNHIVARYSNHQYHDNGDGQDMFIWLPSSVNRADPQRVSEFGHDTIPLLLHQIEAAQQELATADYPDINPKIRLTVGLAHVEKNRFEGVTTSELWAIDGAMNTAARSGVGYTEAARAALGGIDRPQ